MRLVFASGNLLLGAMLSFPSCGKRDARPAQGPAPAPVQVARGPNLGEAAQEIAGLDLAGQPLRLSDYRGKVVLLNFWADW